jgi:hypothetical protein
MRMLTSLAALLVAASLFAGTSATTRTSNHDGKVTELRIVRETDGRTYATWQRDGITFRTTDLTVIRALDESLAAQRALSANHSEFGRRHAALGREHAELGREHAELGRRHADLGRAQARGDAAEIEARQRDLEAAQAKIERKQQELEQKLRDLDSQQSALQTKHDENFTDEKIDEIFQRAVREGRAKRD